jgi:tetratricopeptide (TPR) repeat protein
MIRHTNIPAVLILACLAMLGCSRQSVGPYSDGSAPPARNPELSADLAKQAREFHESDTQRAESLLRQALDADLFNGTAHNNIGILFLKQGKLYEATQEFEWARKLLPGHPDPRVNLAIALEAADKHSDAIDVARAALEIHPGYLNAIMAIASIQIRNGLADTETPKLLATITERSDQPQWRTWAQASRLKLEAQAQP